MRNVRFEGVPFFMTKIAYAILLLGGLSHSLLKFMLKRWRDCLFSRGNSLIFFNVAICWIRLEKISSREGVL
jgi:hypothetical protein